MPLHYDTNGCKTLEIETLKIFMDNEQGSIYNPFQALCNWLYDKKFNYWNRKRDFLSEDNVVIMEEKHIDQIIEEGLFTSPEPDEQHELLSQFVGMKVWAN